jgi:hypothetical protein
MPRALLIMLEFQGWEQARPLSYTGQFAIEDGLRANGIETVVVPMIGGTPSSSTRSWAFHAPRLIREKFDFVLIWLVHTEYDQAFWDWVKSIAPIQIGFVIECMTYDQELCEIDERYAHRAEYVLNQLQHCTHALVSDEIDEITINESSPGKALWFPFCVPKSAIVDTIVASQSPHAAFHGVIYQTRAQWLQGLELRNRLMFPPVGDHGTNFGSRFGELNYSMLNYLEHSVPTDRFYLERHVNMLRKIRVEIFDHWLLELQRWGAVVNLPSMAKCYGGRVGEAMAVGRPVLTWEIPNRPRTAALFEDNQEILRFPIDKPQIFLEQLDFIRDNPDARSKIALRAQEKIRQFHTAEVRMRQVLDWISSSN